jgi:hypothetical protein
MFVAYLKTVSRRVPGITEGNSENYDRIGKLQVIIEGKTSKIRRRSTKHSICARLATQYSFKDRQPISNPAHYNRSQTISKMLI